jgi:hypothetical protein
LRYRTRGTGKALLYSVGVNGQDEGGDASLLDEETRAAVIWSRKDVVWPAMAVPVGLDLQQLKY